MIEQNRVRAFYNPDDKFDYQPGDLLIWPRGNRRFGHIGFYSNSHVASGGHYSVEGNVGKFPAVVKVIWKDYVTNPPHIVLRLKW